MIAAASRGTDGERTRQSGHHDRCGHAARCGAGSDALGTRDGRRARRGGRPRRSSPGLVVAVSGAIDGEQGDGRRQRRRSTDRRAAGHGNSSWACGHDKAATSGRDLGERRDRGDRNQGTGGAAIQAPAGAGGKVRAGRPGRRDGAGTGARRRPMGDKHPVAPVDRAGSSRGGAGPVAPRMWGALRDTERGGV